MKAVVYSKYGSPDLLRLKDVEKPTPGDNEVLVEVHAVSVNASDWEMLRGKPLYARMAGIVKPKHQILGSDIAGRVEAVGRNIERFQPGDEVFGDILDFMGGFAEYVCAPENTLTLKPDGLSFERAAAIPQAACIALQGIHTKGRVQQGKKVLVNGAGGGSGSFAVQIAKSFGAEVTGIDNTGKLEMMRSLGADHVIDYTQEDFTKNGKRYDLILDLAAHHSIFDCKRAMRPDGIYLMVGGSMAQLFQFLFLGPIISMSGSRKMGILAYKANKDMPIILELIESGKIAAVIDKRYHLEEVAEALRYLGEGHAKGKVVITVKRTIT